MNAIEVTAGLLDGADPGILYYPIEELAAHLHAGAPRVVVEHDRQIRRAPDFETVVFKFVTDASSRVAEIESGGSDITIEVPYEQFDRLSAVAGINGVSTPVSDIGMIFLNDIEVMEDANVRKAAAHAIDKKAIVDRLLRGYGVPIDTLQAPQYMAFDESIKVAHDPELSKKLLEGLSPTI